jgi:hypothetical protein
MSIPDAPWIREAGHENVKYPVCPICGEVTAEIYKDSYGEVIGCCECVTVVNAWDWMEDQNED